jgi:hypothetical protein
LLTRDAAFVTWLIDVVGIDIDLWILTFDKVLYPSMMLLLLLIGSIDWALITGH